MQERKQNNTTFCFDSIAGKMAHIIDKVVFPLIYKYVDICETTLIERELFKKMTLNGSVHYVKWVNGEFMF